MQASIRTTDRCVIQTGASVGPRADCAIVELTPQMQSDLSAAFAAPHGNVYLAADGTVTADPYVAPPPAADQSAFDAAVAQLKATFNTVRTAAQMNNSLDAITVILRRAFKDLN